MLPARLDHLVFAARDLTAGVAHLEALLGVRMAEGGRHAAWSTRNYLLALGPESYIEVIGPDPQAPPPPSLRPFGMDALEHPRLAAPRLAAPRLAAWCARATDVPATIARAGETGVLLGEARSGARERPDGSRLSWTLSDPCVLPCDGLVPFLIDWGRTPRAAHPASTSPGGCTLIELRGAHPEPERVRDALGALDLELEIAPAPVPALVAVIRSPNGLVELR